VRFPREKNPKRPVMRHDEYLRLLLVASSVSPLLRLALIVAEGTGRRISACRKLMWRDVLFDEGAIRWRAENDKKGYEQVVVMSPDVHEALAARHALTHPSPEALVFPRPRCPSQPCSRHLLDGWLRRAYGLAGLEPHPGGLWHPLRRKWATERKGYPLKDLAAAGGWRDEQTVLRSYQLSDADTVRQIVLYPTQRLNGEGAAGEKLTTRLTTPRHSRRRPHNGNRCRAFGSKVGTAGFEPATP
jgi:integrase